MGSPRAPNLVSDSRIDMIIIRNEGHKGGIYRASHTRKNTSPNGINQSLKVVDIYIPETEQK
jgi:hypothetical protein